jgi:predicted secreted protein
MPTPSPQKLQGYLAQLQVPVSSTQTTVVGLKEVDLEIKTETLDATDHSTDGWKSSLNGLASFSGSAKLDYVTGDSTQQAIRSAIMTATPIAITIMPKVDPDSGIDEYEGTVIITSFKTSGANNNLQGIDITFEGVGALTVGAQ